MFYEGHEEHFGVPAAKGVKHLPLYAAAIRIKL